VTRLRGRLDHLLGGYVHRGVAELDPRVLEVLRLGAYQVLYMGGVPRYAAVSESVDQVRDVVGPGLAGLVNAVLRKVGDGGDGPEKFPDADDDPAGFLASWGSHPRWLIDRWLSRMSVAAVRALVEANNARPTLNIVPLGVRLEDAVTLLRDGGIAAAEVGAGSTCIRLAPGANPSEVLQIVPDAIVQDPAANLVVQYADVPPGTKVADLCAAPGGKALAVSERAVYTLAADRSESRMRMVQDNARRTGRLLGLVVADARHPPFAEFDAVLLDVPCTGTGTLARHPDARWRLVPESIDDLAEIQRDMLARASELIPAGGLLIYSTCTLEPEENTEQIEAFLDTHRDFEIEATGAVPAHFLDARGHLVVIPGESGFDGAFAARLRRCA